MNLKTTIWFVYGTHMGDPVIYGVFHNKGDAESFRCHEILKNKAYEHILEIEQYAVTTNLALP
jgi:hypothetical protein